MRAPLRRSAGSLVVLVHGGSWRWPYGRWLMWPIAHDLRRRGYVTANVGYRRLGRPSEDGGWPSTFDDVQGAIEALSLDGDLPSADRRVMVGHSAGGHLSMWTGGVRPDLCAGVISIGGPLDLEPSWHGGDESVIALLRDAPESERFTATSPIARLPMGVRSSLLHGADDTTVRPAVSERYLAAALEAGDHCERHLIDGEGHKATLLPWSATWRRAVDVIADMVSD